MRVLLVEDDEFKALDISAVVQELDRDIVVERAVSVTTALRTLSTEKFDIVLLDMSLPTFDMSGPGGGGSAQGQGGIEVLRLARKLRHKSVFIIVTQYPDIEIGGKPVSLPDAPKLLSKVLDVTVRRCVLYELGAERWRIELQAALAG